MDTMNKTSATWPLVVLISAACGGSTDVTVPVPATMEAFAGTDQSGVVGTALRDSLKVRVLDADGNGVPRVDVTWSARTAGGQVTPATATTDASGVAAGQFTLGPAEGDQQAQAEISGLAGSPVVFTAHGHVEPLVPANLEAAGGNGQQGIVGAPLTDPLSVRVTDASGHAVPDITVNWSVLTGGGTISPASSTTNGSGVASAELTLGPQEGQQQAQAQVSGLTGSPVVFSATAAADIPDIVLTVVGGGNNVQDRFSSDLWVHGNYAYTGTWGFRDEQGNTVNVWSLGATGAPTLAGSVVVPGIGTVSDVQVSEDGQLLVVSGERGSDGGIYLYSLSNPAAPSLLGSAVVGAAGVHTVTLATINGRLYAFAARNPGFPVKASTDPALLIYDINDPESPTLVATKPFPERDYSIHDTYVRDGIAFVFVWNTGLVIYDVGNGIRGGSPSAPVELSRMVTADNGICCGPSVHNGWWFHNPATGEHRYLFIGQEGAASLGETASGDIHVVDVSDLTQPHEVAFFHLEGAGTHNFWMDETRQVLYAAYYNAGVVALDVSGTLSGDLSGRLLSSIKPGGEGNTFTWGVQLANGYLYAIDMLSGFWQLKTE
jgi:hypothetical protein